MQGIVRFFDCSEKKKDLNNIILTKVKHPTSQGKKFKYKYVK